MKLKISAALLIILAVSFSGCNIPWLYPPEPDLVMKKVKSGKWPTLVDDMDKESLLSALNQSRTYLKRVPKDRIFVFGKDKYTAGHLIESLDEFEKRFLTAESGADLNQALKKDFILYKSVGSDGKGRVIFTGYYEPLLYGSLTKTERFKYPLYKPPKDLIEVNLGDFSKDLSGKFIKGRVKGNRLVPFYSRAEIDRENALADRRVELAWVDDPVDLFFLHIQGSGRVQLENGEVIRVGYAGSNGRQYSSLGRYLINQGLITREQMSMPAIRDWFSANPEKAPELMDHNQSYVFFRKLEKGSVGNINVELTPGRSVALDHKIFPKGALAWIETRKPVMDEEKKLKWEKVFRLVLVQDTGGAIKGPGRLDLFYGHGEEAEFSAGHMKEPGHLFFLVKKP